MPHLLALIWFIIIIAELAIYIIFDGANLGIGILSLIPQKEEDRSLFLHTLGPTWNANETWLLVAAGSLFGAFPIVFAAALNALYVPGVILLVGIILRAVSFEFYDYAVNKRVWSVAFGVGSLLLAIGQGGVIGGVLNGLILSGTHFAGGPFSWATPFTFSFIIGVLASYLVLGDAYLIKKLGREVDAAPFRRILGFIFVGAVAFLGATTFLPEGTHAYFMTRLTDPIIGGILATLITGALIAIGFMCYDTYRRSNVKHIYALTLVVLVLGYAGVFIGTFPYIVPSTVPYWAVASPDSTLSFMLWGMGPFIPIVLLYNWYLASVFRRNPDAPQRVTMYGE